VRTGLGPLPLLLRKNFSTVLRPRAQSSKSRV
jgi:hypothetical protein